MPTRFGRFSALSLVGLLLAGCPTVSPTVPRAGASPVVKDATPSSSPANAAALVVKASTTPTPAPGALPTPTPVPAIAATPTPPPVTSAGLLLGLDGKPAAGVKITAYLIGHDGASLIGHDGASVIASGAGNYALLADDDAPQTLTTTTDASGRFELTLPGGATANVEAAASDDLKAIALGATTLDGLKLNLDHTGSISGQVQAPAGSTQTNLQGLDVYIPGTGYIAKTDSSGRFTLANVPVGSFTVVAQRSKTQTATAQSVAVAAGKATTAPALQFVAVTPKVTSVTPAVGTPGGTLVLAGENFGAGVDASLSVTLNGAVLTSVTRKDDATISVTLPAAPTGGELVVTVDGAVSNKTTVPVAKTLTLANTRHDGFVGETLTLTPQLADAGGNAIAVSGNGLFSWKSDTAAVATVDAAGAVKAVGEGNATLTATLGGLSTTYAFGVHAGAYVTTLAGSAPVVGNTFSLAAGYVDGPGGAARFANPCGLARAADGSLYLADRDNCVIRKVAADGTVSTFAGQVGSGGVGGWQDGPATTARFFQPVGLCLDAQGNLYVADSVNNRIRKVAPDGTVSTLAGGVSASRYVDAQGTAARFNGPQAILLDASGNLLVADRDNHAVRKVAPDGTVTTLVGAGAPVQNSQRQGGYLDGSADTAQLNQPTGLALAANGDLYIADAGNACIRVLSGGQVRTVAGKGGKDENNNPFEGYQDGQGDAARFDKPAALCVDGDGSLLVADGDNGAIRVVTAAGKVTTLLAGDFGVANSPNRAFADGTLAQARAGHVGAILLDADGNLLFTDKDNQRLRKLARPH